MTEAAKTKTATPAAPVRAGAPVAAIVPRSIEEAWRLAQALAGSDLTPKDMKDPTKVMVAIMGGAEVGLPPFQALQSFAIINGRPTLWGDGLLAVVRARGVKVREWAEGETALCEVTRPDTGQVIQGEFSVEDAKKAGLWGKQGPWTQYPKRMLKMRARAFAIRDGCADMLRGIQVREEVMDYGARDITPPRQQLAIEAQTDDAEIEVVDGPPVVEVRPEPNALKLSPSEAWAREAHERFDGAEETHDIPALKTWWDSPETKAARRKCHDANAVLAGEVKTAFEAALTRLAALEVAG